MHEAHANGMLKADHREQLLAEAGFSNVTVDIIRLDVDRFKGTEQPVPSDVVLIVG